MSIDPGNDQYVRPPSLERRLQIGPEEGAVPFLHDGLVVRAVVEFRQQLAPVGAGNRHVQVVLPHLQERVVQIRGELLLDPEDGLAVMPERLGERVDRRDKASALLGEAGMLPEKVIEHIYDEKRHPGHNCSGSNL